MRVLIEFHSSIGDFITELPILHALKESGRLASVEVVVRTPCDSLLENYDWISAIHVRDRGVLARFRPAFNSCFEPFDLRLYMRRQEGIDLGAVLVRSRKMLGVESFDPGVAEQGVLVHRFSILRHVLGNELPRVPPTRIQIPEKLRLEARTRAGLPEHGRILCIAPGAGRPRKLWPQERFVGLIEALRSDFEHVAVIGSRREARICDEIARETGTTSFPLDLPPIAALLGEATLHIGNDSALGHLAASEGCHAVAIGPEYEYFRPWRGYAVRGRVQEISVDDVLSVVTENGLNECLRISPCVMPGWNGYGP